jgi:hypothetical protein
MTEHGSVKVAVQDFTGTNYRHGIVHEDGFQLPYVGHGFIVKETMEGR